MAVLLCVSMTLTSFVRSYCGVQSRPRLAAVSRSRSGHLSAAKERREGGREGGSESGEWERGREETGEWGVGERGRGAMAEILTKT